MPVEIPLDRICVRTGVLCPRCQSLVDQGLYDDLDIRVMRALLELEEKLGSISVKFVKAHRYGSRVVVLVNVDRGQIPVWLGEELRKVLGEDEKVIVLPEAGSDIKRLVEGVIHPLKVVDVKKVYSLDGGVDLIVEVPEDARERLDPSTVSVLIDIVQKRLGARLYLRYVKTEGPREPGVKVSLSEMRRVLDRIDRF